MAITQRFATEDYVDTKVAAYVDDEVAALVNSAPETLDTLGELAAAFEENQDMVETLNAAVTNKAEKSDLEDAQDLISTNTDSINSIQTQVNGLLELIYPKGAIYISTISTNPSVLFGFGTWEQIKDTFLLSAGDTYTAGSTGGEATHTLNIEEMPSHTHTFQAAAWVNKTGDIVDSNNTEYIDYEISRQTQATGGSQPHNNMPPYLAVYMYKRIE